VVPSAASAGISFRTRPFTPAGERIPHGLINPPGAAGSAGSSTALGIARLAGGSVVSFGGLRVAVALVPDELHGQALAASNPPSYGWCSSDNIDVTPR
jgi:hypothetical protein